MVKIELLNLLGLRRDMKVEYLGKQATVGDAL